MAISNLIPEVWSAELFVALQKALVYGSLVNRDYEGEITGPGSSVHITSLVDPTIGTYTPHNDITVEDVDDAEFTLTIDQSKYFAFEVDDVETAQVGTGVLPTQTQRAAYRLRDIVDTYVSGLMSAAVPSANQIAEFTVDQPEEAYDTLVDLSVKLDEADVPAEQRFAVITPAFHGKILKDDRFVANGEAGGVKANGEVGQAAGFSLFKSNKAPNGPGAGAGKQIIAGNTSATTFADAIVKVEAARMEKRFADLVKGLHVYGAKVVRPTELAAADVIVA